MKPFRITGLTIENFGPFGSLKMDFPEKPAAEPKKAEVHILTGENGTGKTTVLEALVAGVLNNLPAGLSSKSRSNRAIEQPESLEGPIQKVNNLQMALSIGFSQGSNVSIKRSPDGSFLKPTTNEEVQYFHQCGNDLPFRQAFFAYSSYRRVDQASIGEIKDLKGDPMSNSLNFKSSVDPQQLLQWVAITKSKEALHKDRTNDFSPNKFSLAIQSIENAIQKIVGQKIKFILEYEPLAVKIEVDDLLLDFNLLPDGLKSIISWIADLLIRLDRVKWENDTPVLERNFILFLDEIEVHMHPAWQRKILPAVQELFPNAQIFISTHSPFVVGSVDGAWIHKLEKPNGDSKLAAGYPMLSEDAKSYAYWLNEVFGIREQFGAEVEQDMKTFYDLRNRLLKGEGGAVSDNLIKVGQSLAEQSQEVNQIIQMEIRQINRQKGLQLSI